MRRTVTTVLATAIAALLCACGSPSDGAGGGSDGKLTPVSIGVLSRVDVAPVYLGKHKDIFAKHGIDLKIVTAASGAAAVPGVLNGEFDYAYANDVTVIVARSQGLPLKIASGGAASTGVAGKDYAGLVVGPDSPIRTAADLKNKKVGVNILSAIADTSVRASARKAGADAGSITFVKVDQADVPQALASGRIDAGWVAEPYLTAATDKGNRVVANSYVDVAKNLSAGVYFTTEDVIASNPDLYRRMTQALAESLAYAEAHPDEVRWILPSYSKTAPELAERIILPRYPAVADAGSLTALAAAAHRDGLTVDALNIAELTP